MSTNKTKAQLEVELKLAKKQIARLEREAKKTIGETLSPGGHMSSLKSDVRPLQEENKYRARLEQLPIVVYINPTNDPSYTVYISPQIETIFGYSTEAWLADPKLWSKMLHAQDRERVLAEMQRIRDSHQALNIEYRMIVADNRIVWVHDEIVLVRDADGEPQFWQGYMIDITERKQVEEALYKSEERFRTTFDYMLEGVQIIGFDWNYLYLNKAAEKHNRRPNTEMLGRNHMEMWPGIEATHVFAMIKRCMEERIPCQMDTEFIYADQTSSWFELSIQAIPDGVFILSIDITERKQAEYALEEQEFWLKASQRAAHIGSYVLDIEKQTWNSSDVLDDIFGMTGDAEKTIASWEALIHPEQHDEMLHYLTHNVFELHQPFNKEYQIIRASDGQVRWVWGQGQLSMDETGNPSKMFGVIQDITERKQAEQSLFTSEQRYRLLFENMPIAIWEEDFSHVRNHLIALKQKGIVDFRAYFADHPQAVAECGSWT
jgi:two-component system cell cycle sensor histidine kinase/response regulator CckA